MYHLHGTFVIYNLGFTFDVFICIGGSSHVTSVVHLMWSPALQSRHTEPQLYTWCVRPHWRFVTCSPRCTLDVLTPRWIIFSYTVSVVHLICSPALDVRSTKPQFYTRCVHLHWRFVKRCLTFTLDVSICTGGLSNVASVLHLLCPSALDVCQTLPHFYTRCVHLHWRFVKRYLNFTLNVSICTGGLSNVASVLHLLCPSALEVCQTLPHFYTRCVHLHWRFVKRYLNFTLNVSICTGGLSNVASVLHLMCPSALEVCQTLSHFYTRCVHLHWRFVKRCLTFTLNVSICIGGSSNVASILHLMCPSALEVCQTLPQFYIWCVHLHWRFVKRCLPHFYTRCVRLHKHSSHWASVLHLVCSRARKSVIFNVSRTLDVFTCIGHSSHWARTHMHTWCVRLYWTVLSCRAIAHLTYDLQLIFATFTDRFLLAGFTGIKIFKPFLGWVVGGGGGGRLYVRLLHVMCYSGLCSQRVQLKCWTCVVFSDSSSVAAVTCTRIRHV